MRATYILIGLAAFVSAADQSWETKPSHEWTKGDARQILADSPWARSVNASLTALETEAQRRLGGNMGLPHGIGFDGIADDRTRSDLPNALIDLVKPSRVTVTAGHVLRVLLRWESALPIRVAEMKAGEFELPTSEESGYRIAVYGIPAARVKGDPKSLGEPLKKLAVLRREGKKDATPMNVEVFQPEDGLAIVYLFSPAAEISRGDGKIEFRAQIGRIAITQAFDVKKMIFEGILQI